MFVLVDKNVKILFIIYGGLFCVIYFYVCEELDKLFMILLVLIIFYYYIYGDKCYSYYMFFQSRDLNQ